MKTIGLKDFFGRIGYDWRKDLESIKDICYYTKSRVNNNKPSTDFELAYGMEQPFALKALADWSKSNYFFEIGTGRGTGSYSVSLCNDIKKVDTIDIIPFSHKRNEAIGYDPALVSNFDLYQYINNQEKEKIKFHERKDFAEILKQKPANGYDLFFIDGNHTDFKVIAEDFLMCQIMASDNPIIVWDDFYPDKFAIKDVVAAALKENTDFKAFLLPTRGHLFGDKEPEKKSGMVVMMKEKLYEDILTESE